MNTPEQQALADRIENLIHRHPQQHNIHPQAIGDAVRAFIKAGGQPSSGPAGAYLPSGESLDSWINDQTEFSPHWFQPPAPPVAVAKPKVRNSAADRLALANGDAEPRL